MATSTAEAEYIVASCGFKQLFEREKLTSKLELVVQLSMRMNIDVYISCYNTSGKEKHSCGQVF